MSTAPEFRMSAKPDPSPEPDPTPATKPAPTPAPEPVPEPKESDTIPGRLPAGTYEFTGPLPTQYLDVPLTAHPADGTRPSTVFAWPFGAPADGRWAPTKKKPNQLPDNAPADPEGE
ncbi:hypothetical protein F3K32_42545 [Streptomyces sp. LBUM 1483]|uniref:hypothetical protein n=1 Tax=Streptomyces scabiei TaxID=1930 RepID=UPI001B31B316|nr:hypothetical protein [Streptomyces sp. LBUM 1483]MBP5926689.1 hypothetical protein [Streptomyces sp. LBUM 1483]